MNKAQKEILEAQLKAEKQTLDELKKVYEQVKKDCARNISQLNARRAFEPENIFSIIYQKKYQNAIAEQVDGALKHLNDNQYKTVDDYVQDSYHNGYTGIMYDLHKHNIPIVMPIDQEQVTNAIQINSKISQGMYSRLGEDVDKLKDTIRFEVSRGIANGSTWVEVGEQIANEMNSPFDIARNNAMRIARTEGHRVQEEAGLDAMRAAKEAGADVVKQWSATLDERTRPEHQEADGQIREIDEPFDVGGEDLMMPGDGSAFNCINCRCTANMRARSALDESDLERLKQRAKFYGLDKTKDFDDFKDKYLKALKMNSDRDHNDWSKTKPRLLSKDTLIDLKNYGAKKDINIIDLSGFDGDPDLLKEQIDTLHYMKSILPSSKTLTLTVSGLDGWNDFGETRNKTIIIQNLALRDGEITKKNINAFPNQFASTNPEDIAAHEYGHWYANAEKIKRNGLEYARQAYYNSYNKEADDEMLYSYLATNISETAILYGYKELTPEILAKHNSSPDVFTESFIAVINSKGV